MDNQLILKVFEPQKTKDKRKNKINKLLPKPPFRMIVVGSTGTGKSNFIKNLIYNDTMGYGGYFDYIFIFCGSVDDVDEYELLAIKNRVEMWDEDREKYVNKRIKLIDKIIVQQTLEEEELYDLIDIFENNEFFRNKRFLFVFDDMIVDRVMTNNNKMNVIDLLMVRGRHFNASVIISTQKWTALKQNIRMINSSQVVLFNGIPKSNLKAIAKELSGFMDENDFKELYFNLTKQPFSFMIVNLKSPRDKYIQDKTFNYIN